MGAQSAWGPGYKLGSGYVAAPESEAAPTPEPVRPPSARTCRGERGGGRGGAVPPAPSSTVAIADSERALETRRQACVLSPLPPFQNCVAREVLFLFHFIGKAQRGTGRWLAGVLRLVGGRAGLHTPSVVLGSGVHALTLDAISGAFM